MSAADLRPDGFTFGWAASTDDDANLNRYEVQLDGVDVDATGPGTRYYTFDGLEPETLYTVRVRAVDDDGLESEWSDDFEVTTIAVGDPDPPTPHLLLRPTSTFSNDNFDPATVVGTQPVLGDEDDATYMESDEGQFPYDYLLEPMVGYETGMDIRLFVRLSVTGDGTPVDAHAEVFLATSTGAANSADEFAGFSDGSAAGFGFYIPKVDGSILTVTAPLSLGSWSPTVLADVVAALEAGAYLDFNNIENSNWDTPPVVQVYDAWILVSEPGTWNDVTLSSAFILEPSGYGSATHVGSTIVCSTSPTRATNVLYNGLTVDPAKYYEVEVTWGGIVHNDSTPPYGIGQPYGGNVVIRSTSDISAPLAAYDGYWYRLSAEPEQHIAESNPHPDVERFVVGPGMMQWDDAVADTDGTIVGIHVETPYSEIVTSMRWREIG